MTEKSDSATDIEEKPRRRRESASAAKPPTGKAPAANENGAAAASAEAFEQAVRTGKAPAPTPAEATKEVEAAIVAAFAKLKRLEEERAEINAEAKAVREGLIARGLYRPAISACFTLWKQEENKREIFDSTFVSIRSALGIPVQTELRLEDIKPETKH